jgi:TolB-like protein
LRLLAIDPLSGYANVIFCLSCVIGGRPAEALEHGRKAVELDPNSYAAHWSLALALAGNAQYEEAAVTVERSLSISGRHNWALASFASVYASWNKPAKARAVYRELEARSEREYIQPSMLAEAAGAAGDMDRAIGFAQQALDEKDPLFVLFARTWPGYDRLRTDSRFVEIASRLAPSRSTDFAPTPYETRAKPIDSLAVLPFVNASGDPATEYLSDGITESVINGLSQLSGLKVMARNTVFRYKGREIDATDLKRDLGVRAALLGRVLQFMNTTIRTELVDTADGRRLGRTIQPQASDISPFRKRSPGDLRNRSCD